jgi:hypothetical protein
MEPFRIRPDGTARQVAAGPAILPGSHQAGEDFSLSRIHSLNAVKSLLCAVLFTAAVIAGLPAAGFADQTRSVFSSLVRTDASGLVTIRHGKLFVDGQPFNVRGVNYNPTPIGSDTIDPGAPRYDVPRIAALGANTLGTYNLGRAEWGKWSDVTSGEIFYDTLVIVAEALNLRIVVGYLSNHTIDWTDRARVARVTAQYQRLVLRARNRPSTLMYLIGNEVFEKLPSDVQREAYAMWIGEMVTWTHASDPQHPVVYADSGTLPGLRWLRSDAPTLDIYGVNNYAFTTPETLSTMLAQQGRAWPGKPIFLHEWGTDSWRVEKRVTDERAQGARLKELAEAIDTVYGDPIHPLIGSLYFAYSDEWRFVGPWTTQDPDPGWTCTSCFDGQANEDYWGLTRAVAINGAAARPLKAAFRTLQGLWSTEKVAQHR